MSEYRGRGICPVLDIRSAGATKVLLSAEYFYGTGRNRVPKRSGKPSRPNDPRGKAATGRITKIMVGQGHGFIGLGKNREVYFHRSDSKQGTAFNDLRVGDRVTFELLEDPVSGARALRVTRKEKHRRAAS